MPEWRVHSLPEVYEFASGLSKPRSEFGSGFPFLSFKDVFYNRFVPKDLVNLVQSSEVERKKGTIKRGDVFLTRTSETMDELGMSCVSLSDVPDATFNGFTKRLRPKDENYILPEYAGYFFSSPRFRQSVNAMSTMSTRASLNNDMLSRLEIVVPEPDEQLRIANVLKPLDDKIELNLRMNGTLEEMARALFRDWFVDFGPTRRQMDGATDPAAVMGHAFPPQKAATLAPLFPAKLGDNGLPEGWEMGRLDDWAVSASSTVKPDEVKQDTSYIGLEHMPRRSIALGQWETAAKVTSNKARFEKGQILFGKLRPYFHKVGIAPCDGICSTDIVVADGRQKEFRPFVTTLMSTDDFVAYTNQSSTGTKMPRTSWKLMRAFEAPKAPKELVMAFGDFAQPMHDKIVHSLSENQTLAEMRDLLLPKLMSGDIRLKDAEVAQ